jgi:hypothetical protein
VRRLVLAALLALVAGGCAYYNGMYNAKRLAGQAQKAERQGRNFEASNLWGQVSIKAESLLVRHPNSRWAEEARLLQGTAYAKLRDCERALPPLETVMVAGRNREFAERAAMLVGTCRLRIGDPLGASSAYARLLDSRDLERRDVALWAHGRSLRLAGEYEAAAAELAASRDPRARGELAAALGGAGRVPEAVAIADSLLEPPDSTAPWEDILTAIGARDRSAASALTGRIAASRGMPRSIRTLLLIDDAERMAVLDSAAAERRLVEADSIGASTAVTAEVVLARARLQLRTETSIPALRKHAQALTDYSEFGAALAPTMLRIAAAIVRSTALADSVVPGAPLDDMKLFLAAEVARDSAEAPGFAERLFRRIPAEWPDSPYGAKALMAVMSLDPGSSDSLAEVLTRRFASSPYVVVASGGDGREILALEDSLRRFALLLSRPPRPTRQGQPGRPQPTRPADDLP